MKFEGTRNWFLIAIAIGSPYYWGQYLLAKSTDAATVTIAALFGVLSLILLVFLLRKQYIELTNDTITLQSPFRRRTWQADDILEISMTEKWIGAIDKDLAVTYLMIPQKPEQFQKLQQAVSGFCRHHKIPITNRDLRDRRNFPESR